MQDLAKLDDSVLIDMLADYTTELTKLLQAKNKDENYVRLKQVIKQVMAEIETRRAAVRNNKEGLFDLV